MEGGEYMDKEYEETQKEIDKLLQETSEERTHKKHQDMIENEKYKSKMKKIGKLLLKLEKFGEENRKNGRNRGNINI